MIQKKANIAVFISGRGTNLKALILSSKKQNCNYNIALVVSNKKEDEYKNSSKENEDGIVTNDNVLSKVIEVFDGELLR